MRVKLILTCSQALFWWYICIIKHMILLFSCKKTVNAYGNIRYCHFLQLFLPVPGQGYPSPLSPGRRHEVAPPVVPASYTTWQSHQPGCHTWPCNHSWCVINMVYMITETQKTWSTTSSSSGLLYNMAVTPAGLSHMTLQSQLTLKWLLKHQIKNTITFLI